MTELATVVAAYPEANLAMRAAEHLCQSGIDPGHISTAMLGHDLLGMQAVDKGADQAQGRTFLVIVQSTKESVSYAQDILQGTRNTFHTVHGERVRDRRY